MRTAAILLLALTAPVFAQTPSSAILIDVEDDTLLPGQSTTVTLWAAWPEHEFAFARTKTNLWTSVGSEGWSGFELIPPMDFVATSAGESSVAGVDGIFAWQVNLCATAPRCPLRDNPIAFWQATYTAPAFVASGFNVDLTTRTTEFDVYFMPESLETVSYLGNVVEGEATIRVIPAPASIAVLGGLLVFARRRREPRT